MASLPRTGSPVVRAFALAALLTLTVGLAFEPAPSQAQASGTILAVLGRQVGILRTFEPRRTNLTNFASPSYVLDIAAVTATPLIAISLVQPLGDPSGALGGDIVAFDRTTSVLRPMASRASSGETLSFPAWWPDGSALLFNRSAGASLSGTLELMWMDGTAPIPWIDDATHPAVAPDGREVAFVRYSQTSSSLISQGSSTGVQRTIVPSGRFLDIAYPRYSPDGSQIVFSVPGEAVLRERDWLASIFQPSTAFAHGFPRDIWIVNTDGTGLRPLAQLGADDPSLAWSPDGTQVFVYAGDGGWFVDAQSGESTPLDFVSGYGATAWLP